VSPIRLQRKRGKDGGYYDNAGNRYDPKDVVYVGRGSKWGNPWSVSSPETGVWFSTGPGRYAKEFSTKKDALTDCINQYRAQLERLLKSEDAVDFIRVLRGLHLACWCGFDRPCHADALLALANEPPA